MVSKAKLCLYVWPEDGTLLSSFRSTLTVAWKLSIGWRRRMGGVLWGGGGGGGGGINMRVGRIRADNRLDEADQEGIIKEEKR